MEADEIRAEIERRRNRAIDLKLRETLWTLYYWHLRSYAENLKKDPEMVYPEIREALEISDAHIQFHVGESTYTVIYKEGPVECESDWRRHGNYDNERRTTPVTLALKIDEKRVFEFEVKKTVTDTRDGPLFDESMGNVTSFIEGPWVTDIAELLQKMKAHKKSVQDKQRAPKLQEKLRQDMERFGL